MKPFNTNEVAAHLKISRSTVRRLAAKALLRPDGYTGAGRPYWYRATLDAFQLGAGHKRNALAFYTTLLPSISCATVPGPDLLGQHIEVVKLMSTDLLSLLSELYATISACLPADLVLPAQAIECPTGLAVIRAATTSGCNVVLRHASNNSDVSR